MRPNPLPFDDLKARGTAINADEEVAMAYRDYLRGVGSTGGERAA